MANGDVQIDGLRAGVVLTDRYRLDRWIGGGGFGEVWLATDLHLDHSVAVKILKLQQIPDPEKALRLFENEAKLAVHVDHPNIVRMLDLDCHEPHHFLVMEYLDGSDLEVLLSEVDRLPAAAAVRTLEEALEGLGALHERAILHRDVKPQNILIRRDDSRVKLSDLGLAKSLEATETLTGGLPVGTPLYMAPELWEEQPATRASDVFAMGVVLFKMLRGVVPWDTSSLPALMRSIRRDTPPAIADESRELPSGIDEFLAGCLAKDPLVRTPDAQAAVKELDRLKISEKATPPEDRLLRNRVAIVGLKPDLRKVLRGCLGASGLLSPVISVAGCDAPELHRGLGQLDAMLLDPQCGPAERICRFINKVRSEHRKVVFFLLLPSADGREAALSGFSHQWRKRFDHFFKAYLDTALTDLPGLVSQITRMIIFDQTYGLSK